MSGRIRRVYVPIPKWLIVLVLCTCAGFLITTTGASLNRITKDANEGRMPVAVDNADLFFTVGTPQQMRPGGQNISLRRLAESETHQPMHRLTKYPLLADRILLSLGFQRKEGENSLALWYFDRMRLHLHGETVVSIGDVLIWIGIMMMETSLVLIPPMLIFSLIRRCIRAKRNTGG